MLEVPTNGPLWLAPLGITDILVKCMSVMKLVSSTAVMLGMLSSSWPIMTGLNSGID